MLNTKDPYLLLSMVNMKLRDEAENLKDLCSTYNKDQQELEEKLNSIGYYYEATQNQFIAK